MSRLTTNALKGAPNEVNAKSRLAELPLLGFIQWPEPPLMWLTVPVPIKVHHQALNVSIHLSLEYPVIALLPDLLTT